MRYKTWMLVCENAVGYLMWQRSFMQYFERKLNQVEMLNFYLFLVGRRLFWQLRYFILHLISNCIYHLSDRIRDCRFVVPISILNMVAFQIVSYLEVRIK